MKVFLIGSFKEREKIEAWFQKINSLENTEIIYDWTKHTFQDNRKELALENFDALENCDIFVFDVGEQGSLGKSILLGAAMVLNKPVFIIGQFPEIIFGELIPNENKFEKFDDFFEFLKSRREFI